MGFSGKNMKFMYSKKATMIWQKPSFSLMLVKFIKNWGILSDFYGLPKKPELYLKSNCF